MPWSFVLDGSPDGMSKTPLASIVADDWARVPLLAGTNENEGQNLALLIAFTIFPGIDPLTLTRAQIIHVLEHWWPTASVELVLEEYDSFGLSYWLTLTAILRDDFFVCSTRRAMRAVDAANHSAFLYHFTYRPAWLEYQVFGDFHGAELVFVFGTPDSTQRAFWSDSDERMSVAFGRYWTTFAATLAPGTGGAAPPHGAGAGRTLARWPQWLPNAANASLAELDMRMDVPPLVETDYRSRVCAVWDRLRESPLPTPAAHRHHIVV